MWYTPPILFAVPKPWNILLFLSLFILSFNLVCLTPTSYLAFFFLTFKKILCRGRNVTYKKHKTCLKLPTFGNVIHSKIRKWQALQKPTIPPFPITILLSHSVLTWLFLWLWLLWSSIPCSSSSFFFSLLFFLVDYERMVALMVKNLPANAEDKRNVDLIPGLGRRTFSVPWRRARQPTPVFLPGEFHGQRSLVGYGPQGCKESDTTEVT